MEDYRFPVSHILIQTKIHGNCAPLSLVAWISAWKIVKNAAGHVVGNGWLLPNLLKLIEQYCIAPPSMDEH
jgi:hypothetical protein